MISRFPSSLETRMPILLLPKVKSVKCTTPWGQIVVQKRFNDWFNVVQVVVLRTDRAQCFFNLKNKANLKVVLWSKICIPFSLHFWGAEVLSTYHAKFYLKIRTGSQVIFTLFLGFGRPPLLDSKMTGRIKTELALVNQIGSDVIFASHQNIVANFLCNPERSETSSKIFSGFYNL